MKRCNYFLEMIGRASFDVGEDDTKKYQQFDFAHMLAGLSPEATAWVMFAYSNSNDKKSLKKVAALLSKFVVKRCPAIRPQNAGGLVAIVLCECLKRPPDDRRPKHGSIIVRAKEMGIAISTYYKHQDSINLAVDLVLTVVSKWEEQATKIMESRL